MSGIVGEVSFSCNLQERKEELLSMRNAILHRGPDSQSGLIVENVALLQNSVIYDSRISVKLPFSMKKDEVEYTIIFDGLIYNRNELKSILKDRKYSFESNRDEELMLKAYLEFGDDCLKLVNGIFAMAIWDSRKKRLFIARDRFGIKPFFYSISNGNFIFASEIKALLKSDEIKPKINLNSILEIMLIGPGKTPGYGVFENISELLPATCGYFDKGGLKLKKFWALYPQEHTDNVQQTVDKVRFLVNDSIVRQLKADAPVCTMLSGGLDSSIITAVTDKIMKDSGKQLDTYTVTYADNDKYFTKSKFQPNSDNDFVGKMNDILSANNHVIEIGNEELVSALFSAVEARDLPGMADVDSSLLLFSKAIAKDYRIVLSGECSDEIFGGYPWYRDPILRNSDSFPWAKSTSYRNSFLINDIADSVDAENYVKSKYEAALDKTARLNTPDKDERTKELMRLHLDWFMMTLVDRSDRMSAFNSLDIRVPYCDYRIVEYLYSIPLELKDYKGYEKGLLREAFKDILPEEILWRKKSPYPKTHNPKYLELVKNELKCVLEDSNAPIFKFASKEALSNLLLENSQQPFYGQLMTTPQTIAYFVQVNYWLNKYEIEINL